jgi:hypothetical protein
MYGTILKLGMQAAPHLLKAGGTTAVLGGIGYGGASLAAGGTKLLGGQGFLNNLYEDQLVQDGGVFKPRGITAQILKPFVEEGDIEAAKLKGAREDLLVSLNENPADYNFTDETTLTQAQGQVLGEQRARKKEEKDEAYRRSMELPYMQMQQAREDRLATLDFQRMQMQREDQRYNERLDREERNRRQEAVMAMMGGLTSLGAAFAM